MAQHQRVHQWAQKALDKYNGGYTASDICLNATTYCYELRDNGNGDHDLAVASHYLHCRYVGARAYVVGAIAGAVGAFTYDGIVKLVERFSPVELGHKFGKSPLSRFDSDMLLWDMQGLGDGVSDFMFKWGKVSLYAPYHPMSASLP